MNDISKKKGNKSRQSNISYQLSKDKDQSKKEKQTLEKTDHTEN